MKAIAPWLASDLDELGLLREQLEASQAGEESVTLMLEVVGPPAPSAIAEFASSLPLGPTLELSEVAPGEWKTGPLEKRDPPERRRAMAFCRPGAGSLLEPWFGYGCIDVLGEDGIARKVLVRCTPLEGGEDTEESARARISAWDAAMSAEREARRKGAPAKPEAYPTVVLEKALGTPGRFVATGLALSDRRRHLAACLRAKGGR